MNEADEIILINNGGIAEQVVGQLLRTIFPSYIEPALYYWLREEKGSNAEIDYIIQHGNKLIPIEVKAGSTGSLKSLHLFMGSKKLSLAVRINSDLPSKTGVNVKDHSGDRIEYKLLSLPFYLIGQMHRLLDLQ
jgi:predicted AAA+ superfamily ATPase